MMFKKYILPWGPALLMMAVIFLFSSTPSKELPDFGLLDLVIKKGAHMIGYGLLAAAYWYGFVFDRRRWWLALLFAILYAISDEFHQSFVPGRHPSWVDALIFDGSGAAAALGMISWGKVRRAFLKNKE
jgi:VanZ family protein